MNQKDDFLQCRKERGSQGQPIPHLHPWCSNAASLCSPHLALKVPPESGKAALRISNIFMKLTLLNLGLSIMHEKNIISWLIKQGWQTNFFTRASNCEHNRCNFNKRFGVGQIQGRIAWHSEEIKCKVNCDFSSFLNFSEHLLFLLWEIAGNTDLQTLAPRVHRVSPKHSY